MSSGLINFMSIGIIIVPVNQKILYTRQLTINFQRAFILDEKSMT